MLIEERNPKGKLNLVPLRIIPLQMKDEVSNPVYTNDTWDVLAGRQVEDFNLFVEEDQIPQIIVMNHYINSEAVGEMYNFYLN